MRFCISAGILGSVSGDGLPCMPGGGAISGRGGCCCAGTACQVNKNNRKTIQCRFSSTVNLVSGIISATSLVVTGCYNQALQCSSRSRRNSPLKPLICQPCCTIGDRTRSNFYAMTCPKSY